LLPISFFVLLKGHFVEDLAHPSGRAVLADESRVARQPLRAFLPNAFLEIAYLPGFILHFFHHSFHVHIHP